MVMSCQFAEQYSKPCIRLEGGETFDEVSEFAYECEATYFDGEDECFVIQFPGRPQELYTEEALRGSLRLG
jgi:hypothetical protein